MIYGKLGAGWPWVGVWIGSRICPILYIAIHEIPKRQNRMFRVQRWPTGGIRIFAFWLFVALGGRVGARIKIDD